MSGPCAGSPPPGGQPAITSAAGAISRRRRRRSSSATRRDQRGELHRLAEADRLAGRRPPPPRGRRAARRAARRSESSTSLREMRACSANCDQVLAPLLLLDLAGARQSSVSRSPYSSRSCAAVFGPMPGHARHVVGGIADQRLQLDHLLRIDAELLLHALAVDDLAFFIVSTIVTPGRTSCIRSLSEETMVTEAPRLARLHRIGRDEVVRLPALLLDAGEVEGARRLADQPELRDEVGGRVGPVRLVVGIDLAAKRLGRIVEDDGEMRRLVARLRRRPFLQHLPDHVAEAERRRSSAGRPTCASAAAARGRRGR